MSEISVDESRAVLCVHMLCYVLDGSIGFSELSLWKDLTDRVEEVYQEERSKFHSYKPSELREFIILKCPFLTTAISRIPVGDPVSPRATDMYVRVSSTDGAYVHPYVNPSE